MTTRSSIRLWPLLGVAVSLVAGILTGDALYGFMAWSVWLAVLVVAVCCVAVSFFFCRNGTFRATLVAVAAFAGGAFSVSHSEKAMEVALDGEPEMFEAVVWDTPRMKPGRVWCNLLVTSGRLAGKHITCGLVSGRADSLHVGDGIRMAARVKSIENADGSRFDYRRWCEVHAIVGRAFAVDTCWRRAAVGLSGLSLSERFALRLRVLRQRMLLRCGDTLSESAYAVVAAMTLGDRTALTRELRDTYSAAGVSHVLALSGLHLGIVYGFLSFLFMRRRARALGQTLVIVAIWSYVFMVGMPSSVVRSATMLTVFSFVSLLRRRNVSVNTLSLAAVVLLVANPLSLWDAGFQMSFMAVLGIVIASGRFYGVTHSRFVASHWLVGWVWSMVMVSVSAQIMVLPLMLHYFGRFPCLFLVSNFVAVPLSTFIVYGGLLLVATLPLPAVNGLVAVAVERLVEWLNGSLGWIASLPYSSVDNIEFGIVQVVLCYVAIALAYRLSFYLERLVGTQIIKGE